MGMFKTAVVTDKGQALLTKCITGTANLEFTKVALSENVLADELEKLTSIGTIKQSSGTPTVTKGSTEIKVSAAFSNASLTSGYYIRNIGVFAKDPDEGEILYSISVAEELDWMPAFTNRGETSVSVSVVTAVSNVEDITIVMDNKAAATMTHVIELQEQITVLQEKNAQLKQAMGAYNLLDNSDFRNPINQRKIVEWTNPNGYTIDRWKVSADAMVLKNSAVQITTESTLGTIKQVLENYLSKDKKYTMAICAHGSGTFKLAIEDTYYSVGVESQEFTLTDAPQIYVNTFDISSVSLPSNVSKLKAYPNTNINIEWIALYEGEYTVDTLPNYKYKGYGVELAECQRYLRVFNADGTAWYQLTRTATYEGNSKYVTALIPIQMKSAPQVTMVGNWRVIPTHKLITGGGAISVTGIAAGLNASYVGLTFNVQDGISEIVPYTVSAHDDASARIYLSAEPQ